jgi:hypothetical protein
VVLSQTERTRVPLGGSAAGSIKKRDPAPLLSPFLTPFSSSLLTIPLSSRRLQELCTVLFPPPAQGCVSFPTLPFTFSALIFPFHIFLYKYFLFLLFAYYLSPCICKPHNERNIFSVLFRRQPSSLELSLELAQNYMLKE